ncbi:FAD-binding protein [Aureimonas sp. AU40]|uniref:FAD-binding protein n=1 Tax=Aureimonas sp. AU40 TaxID=1637747 RepID=UPI000B2227B1|nr:FAD-binding protein [Aureimonas sp. AU40]
MRARRDPRAERATHLLAASSPRPRYDWTQRIGRPRRDPRAEASAQIARREPRLRLDRQQHAPVAFAAQVPLVSAPDAAPAAIVVDDAALRILVVADPGSGPLTALDRQLLAAARLAAGKAGGVVLAIDREAPEAGAAGADRVVILAPPPHPADRFEQVAALHRSLALPHLVLAETPGGGDLARRLAARFALPFFPGVEQIGARGLVRAVRGRKVDQERAELPGLLTLVPDMVPLRAEAPREGKMVTTPDLPPSHRTVERVRPARGSLALADSDFVVSAGNGIRDFDLFRALTQALGGTPGASRVVCDSGDMPRAAQVGASGTVLAADCYLAFGIAGAPQHLQGIAGCVHVLAVNTDLHAAMVERAELSIVADAHPVMAALLRLLEEDA